MYNPDLLEEDYSEDFLAYCNECDEEVDAVEASNHTFVMNGYPISFHRNCCPEEIGYHFCYNH